MERGGGLLYRYVPGLGWKRWPTCTCKWRLVLRGSYSCISSAAFNAKSLHLNEKGSKSLSQLQLQKTWPVTLGPPPITRAITKKSLPFLMHSKGTGGDRKSIFQHSLKESDWKSRAMFSSYDVIRALLTMESNKGQLMRSSFADDIFCICFATFTHNLSSSFKFIAIKYE